MQIFNSVKKVFEAIGKNPTIALFFIIFLIVFNILFAYIFVSKTALIATLISICSFMLFASFFAGWFGLIKKALNEEKQVEKPFLIFLEEIGKNVLPLILSMFLYIFILTLIIFVVGEINFKIFGNPDVIFQGMLTHTQNPTMLAQYIKNLSDDDKFIIYGWQLSIIFASGIINFLFLFYLPAIFEEIKKNVFLKPFIALKNAISYTFKNFFKSLGVFFLIGIFNVFLSFLNHMLSYAKFGSLIFLFIYIYFVISAIMLIFKCYEKNNCTDGCDCIGEDKSCDKISEED